MKSDSRLVLFGLVARTVSVLAEDQESIAACF